MVEITVKRDGCVKETASGDFMLAVVGTSDANKTKRVFHSCGKTSDKNTALAVATLIRKVVREVIHSDNRALVCDFLLTTIEMELKLLKAKETPEAATSGESGK